MNVRYPSLSAWLPATIINVSNTQRNAFIRRGFYFSFFQLGFYFLVTNKRFILQLAVAEFSFIFRINLHLDITIT